MRRSSDCTVDPVNKRPGHVVVVTEVGFCSFCGRTRNLRNERHQLGTLVRTIVACETCHRTLSSTIGIATALPEPVEAGTGPPPEAEPAPESPAEPATKAVALRKPVAAKSSATKSRAPKKN